MSNEKIIKKIIELDYKVDQVAEDVQGLDHKFLTKREFHNVMDPMMVILKRLDSERIFTAEWTARIQKTTDRHESRITKLEQTNKKPR